MNTFEVVLTEVKPDILNRVNLLFTLMNHSCAELMEPLYKGAWRELTLTDQSHYTLCFDIMVT